MRCSARCSNIICALKEMKNGIDLRKTTEMKAKGCQLKKTTVSNSQQIQRGPRATATSEKRREQRSQQSVVLSSMTSL